MARRKNVDWEIPNDRPPIQYTYLAVLMDIRDELQTLKRMLNCHNFRSIPSRLDEICKNTAKPVELKKKTKRATKS